jgi:hypothetical protein
MTWLIPFDSWFLLMTWQKTFTLAKRSKGCHLVTEEVLSHIESGLNGVQVWNYAHLAVGRAVANPTFQIGMLFLFMLVPHGTEWMMIKLAEWYHRQHTSAALTINENYDGGRYTIIMRQAAAPAAIDSPVSSW